MTLLPIRPKEAPLALTVDDADIVTIDGASGVRRMTFSAFKAQLLAGIATGLAYKGAVSGASVPESSASTGDYYLISSSGASQGVDWEIGDFALWRGNGWDKMQPTFIEAATGWYRVDTIAELRAIDGHPRNKFARIVAPEPGGIREWWYDASSLADDDGTATSVVAKPDALSSGESGRWLEW